MFENIFPDHNFNKFPPSLKPTDYISLPDLAGVIKENRPFPPFSMLLGIHQDGSPHLENLASGLSSSFLIAGDHSFANTYLLHGILSGAAQLNPPDEVNIHMISPRQDGFKAAALYEHFKIHYDPFEPQAEILIEEMAHLAVERRLQRQPLPFHILAVDGLDKLLRSLSAAGRAKLLWLLDFAGRAGFWVIATLETQAVHKADWQMVHAFQGRILGQVQSLRLEQAFSGRDDLALHTLIPGVEAVICNQGACTRVWVPELNQPKIK
ncbi:MAG: hypothetical protein OEY93_12685 [Anaerolineae bacterium]|nr:hypothetical protein [Anaerolineae bacterium]